MARLTIVEDNVAAFKEQVMPDVPTDLTSFASRLWVHVLEPALSTIFYLFFIVANIVNGILALVFSWTRSLVLRPLGTLVVTFMVLVACLAALNEYFPYSGRSRTAGIAFVTRPKPKTTPTDRSDMEQNKNAGNEHHVSLGQ